MRTLMFLIFTLVALCLETCFSQTNCETRSGIGRLAHSQELEQFSKVIFPTCWTILVPAEKYAKFEVTKLGVDKAENTNVYLTIGRHTIKPPLLQNFLTLSLTDTTVTFFAENVRNPDTITVDFELNFKVESLFCEQTDSFRCNETDCIPKSKVCNGVRNCANGADENDCDEIQGLTIEGLKETRKKAIKLLKEKRLANKDWGDDTVNAVIAIHLATGTNFNEDPEEMLIAKDLELKISSDFDKASNNDKGQYINALNALCYDPKNFNERNLLTQLQTNLKPDSATDDLAYLALCNAGVNVGTDRLQHIEDSLRGNLDQKYYAALTIACASRRGYTTDIRALEATVEGFLRLQREDGSFGPGVKTSAQHVQILMASNMIKDKRWSFKEAVKYVMREVENVPKDLDSLLFALPVLGGRTLADIECHGKRRNETFM